MKAKIEIDVRAAIDALGCHDREMLMDDYAACISEDVLIDEFIRRYNEGLITNTVAARYLNKTYFEEVV